jgi:hypothetical protein
MRLRAQSKSSAEQNWSVTRRGFAPWSVALIVLRITAALRKIVAARDDSDRY